ncbi:MAG TPA: NAD(P)H-hydrate dehydratase [Thermoplasmatales archaeon]|nr:NAD(P)H-hydrate dehydratase [Thermoplasmatales archaeon]
MHPTEVRVLDANAAHHGVPQAMLMENAGRGVAEAALENFDFSRCLVLCGPGNNGGDGLVAARHLCPERQVTVLLAREPSSPLARANLRRAKKNAISVHGYSREALLELLEESDLAIDALLGIGITGALRPPFDDIVQTLNQSPVAVLAVDVPTGLGNNLAVEPDLTVTFHDLKDGMTEANSGTILVHDIGIPREAVEQVGPGDMAFYTPFRQRSHKGQNGVVLTIGGGPFTGAPALAALAALRTGADLSLAAVPERAQPVVASFSPDLITVSLPGGHLQPSHLETLRPHLEKADAVVLGPGLGSHPQTREAAGEVIDACLSSGKRLVVDADAIEAFGERNGRERTVITPHAGEFARLTGVSLTDDREERMQAVRRAAEERNCTLLLKGWVDVISDGRSVKLNHVHNPGMTVGGTGDVLSGIAGALLARNVPAFNAARMAAFINGSAGNRALAVKSYGLTASDLLDYIPGVIKEHVDR